MKCPFCGKELPDDAKYCSFCGEEMAEKESLIDETTPEHQMPKEPKVWITFAKVGHTLGIISICLCWIPLLTLSTVGIPGIVLSALGKKSKLYNHDAHVGFALSLAGSIICSIVYYILIIIINLQ